MPVLANRSASTYISPSSGRYNIGDTVTLGVYIASPDMSVNAVSSVLSFPKEKLEVLSLSKDGSIISFWVQSPSFSNTLGTISYEGVVLNPRFTGEAGKILTITFKVIAAGNGTFSFSSASILANDGKGTNILNGIRNASFVFGNVDTPPVDENKQILSEENEVKIAVQKESLLPKMPVITSSTHPDQTKWYKENDVRVSWQVPAGTVNVRHILSDQAKATPNITHSIRSAYEDMEDLIDGIWYFHLQFANQAGWGTIATYKIQIDTTPPESVEIAKVNIDAVNRKIKFKISAVDKFSGLGSANVVFGDSIANIGFLGNDVEYETPELDAIQYTLFVKVSDNVGNSIDQKLDFSLPTLVAPIIRRYPVEPRVGDPLYIEGRTIYPGKKVLIFIQSNQQEPIEHEVGTDDSGVFYFIAKDRILFTNYIIWAQVIGEDGASSGFSEKIYVSVPPLLSCGGIDWQTIPSNSILIALLLITSIIFFVYRINRRQILVSVQSAINKREDMNNDTDMVGLAGEYLDYLDQKTKLSPEERRLRSMFEKLLLSRSRRCS